MLKNVFLKKTFSKISYISVFSKSSSRLYINNKCKNLHLNQSVKNYKRTIKTRIKAINIKRSSLCAN